MSVVSYEAMSPRGHPGLRSPVSFMPRSSLGWGGSNHSRRLSVPTQPHPFSPARTYQQNALFMSPPMSSAASTFSPTDSAFNSPMQSHFSHDRRNSTIAYEADIRRRTWHPSTYTSTETRPATSGLSYYRTPDAPQSVPTTQPAAQQQAHKAVRLPGIDSFDRPHPEAIARARRPSLASSVLSLDEGSQLGPETPGNRDSWGSMNQTMTHLDIAPTQAMYEEGESRDEASGYVQNPGQSITVPLSGPRFSRPSPLDLSQEPGPAIEGLPANERPMTPRNKRRMAWYNGPNTIIAPEIRASPAGSSNSDEVPTPSTTTVPEYHPAIVHSSGYVETQFPDVAAEVAHKVGLESESDETSC